MALNTLSPVSNIYRRDFTLADPDLADPNESDCLDQGEWVTYDSDGKLVRAANNASPDTFQVFTMKGDFGAQALGKVTILQLHDYEAETDMFDPAPTSPFAMGAPLTIIVENVDGYASRAVLTNDIVANTSWVHGFVTQIPSDNANGMLRFQRVSPHLSAA